MLSQFEGMSSPDSLVHPQWCTCMYFTGCNKSDPLVEGRRIPTHWLCRGESPLPLLCARSVLPESTLECPVGRPHLDLGIPESCSLLARGSEFCGGVAEFAPASC